MANTVNKNVIVPEVYAGLVREKIAGRVQVAQFLKTIDTLRNDVGETITMPAWSYVGDASDWTVGTAMTTKSMVQTKKTSTVKAVAAPGIAIYDYDNEVSLGSAINEAAKQQAISIARKIDIDAINENPFILYFGSLALRSTESFLTLDSILASTSPEEVFVDINLRKDFYSDSILGFCLDNATILKINEDEINVICDMAGIENCDAEELFDWLLENTAIHTLLITRGKHGSDCFTTEGKVHENCSDVKVVDTVGAGDSLSAAYLFYRYEKGLKAAEALHKATAVADYVVGNKGAIPLYSPEMFS